MIYTIVGVPESGKKGVANKLRVFLNKSAADAEGLYDVDPDTEHDFFDLEERTFGFLTDYREELLLAAFRATRTSQHTIFPHSLIDNVAYSSLRVTGILSENPNDPNFEAWSVTFDACLKMLVDGYTDRLILYIPYEGDDDDHKDLDHALRATLDTLKIKYQEIDPEGEVDTWISN